MNDDIEYGREVLRLEAQAVDALRDLLDERFSKAVELVLGCEGHVVVTGMGKSGLIAQKISATLASTGTPSFFLHPAEAIHGDIGRVGKEDLLIAISNSGQTEEIQRLIPAVKQIGAGLVAITGDEASSLARHADCVLFTGKPPEACPVGLAPTTSTTAQLAVGDAMAMTVAKRRNFTREEYAAYHPGGELGRSLMRVSDLNFDKEAVPPATIGATTRDALVEAGGLGRKPGALPVVGPQGNLRGLLTDGDVRRQLLSDPTFIERPIERTMTKEPVSIRADQLAAVAWRIMTERHFDYLPVVNAEGRYLGLLDVQCFLAAGFTESS
ncbi:MAG: KpsF/GutQ family sugar-phosphate isomerase [Planctomycetota bacterium]|jgi:arabinose-5-phosphate isomerase